MPAWLLSDWVLWVLTALCGLVGFTIAIRGLIGDRARGRPTCWKCRYDLSASHIDAVDAGSTNTASAAGRSAKACPECGHVHKKRKHLFKTRRYWFRFAFGAAMFMLALYCHTGPEVVRRRERGEKWWESIVPTTAWIVMLPKLRGNHFTLLEHRLATPVEINARANTFLSPPIELESESAEDAMPMLAGWQASLLVESCRVMIDDPKTVATNREQCIEWVIEARKRTDAAPPVLLKLLDDADETIRFQAQAALCSSRMDRREVAAVMIERLSNGAAPYAKSEAIGGLARLEEHAAAAVPYLVEIMRHDEGRTAQAGHALIAIGGPAVPSFVAMMADPNDALHARAIEAIGRMGKAGSAAWPRLLERMKHGDPSAAGYAMESTTRLGKLIAPFLVVTATDEASPYRMQALHALAQIGPQAGGGSVELLPLAMDADSELAAAAWLAIDAMGFQPGFTKTFGRATWVNLLKALRSENRQVRNFAWGVLTDVESNALPWIEVAINESLVEIDVGIVRLVMQYNAMAKHLSPVLVERMLREPKKFSSEIVDMLVLLGELHPQVLTRMIAALDDDDRAVRQIAEDVLASTPMNVGVLLPILIKRLDLPSDSNRITAIRLLGRMGPQASPALAAVRRIAEGRQGVESAAAALAVEAIEKSATEKPGPR